MIFFFRMYETVWKDVKVKTFFFFTVIINSMRVPREKRCREMELMEFVC